MLSALELVGFKSFADKTRLEFPRGITVIVGPNGSGKSNIVDAIKWVLGEQSVKSLRGKEMADVIFNGSANRRALNAAETTLTFDNSERRLAIDTPEVQITRRVYRSGEGEYLINRQPARLRDIRDLLAGTGMATEAYSIIEQGKVDVLLQATPRDRRLIFEEAAGISRFKAKKIEAQRRLERVEQNLLRLSDIVEEVENRLRTVRLQAAKARRYKEYADRLQELRTQVGLVDWRALSDRLAVIEAELTEMADEVASSGALAERLEAQALAVELEIVESEESIRSNESRIAQNRERIAAYEATIDHERRLSHDLEQEIARLRRQLTAMSLRAGNLDDQLRETTTSLAAIDGEHRQVARQVAEQERGLTRITTELDALRSEHQQHRTAHLDALRGAAALGNQISAWESRVLGAEAICQRGDVRRAELSAARTKVDGELAQHRARLAELAGHSQDREQSLDALRAAWPSSAGITPGRSKNYPPGASGTAAPANARPCSTNSSGGWKESARASRKCWSKPARPRPAPTARFADWWPICSTCIWTRPPWSKRPWVKRPSTWCWPARASWSSNCSTSPADPPAASALSGWTCCRR